MIMYRRRVVEGWQILRIIQDTGFRLLLVVDEMDISFKMETIVICLYMYTLS